MNKLLLPISLTLLSVAASSNEAEQQQLSLDACIEAFHEMKPLMDQIGISPEAFCLQEQESQAKWLSDGAIVVRVTKKGCGVFGYWGKDENECLPDTLSFTDMTVAVAAHTDANADLLVRVISRVQELGANQVRLSTVLSKGPNSSIQPPPASRPDAADN